MNVIGSQDGLDSSSNRAILPSRGVALRVLPDELERTRDYAAAAKAPATLKAYATDWRDFTSWCRARGLDALPAAPETVAVYLTSQVDVGRKASTLQRRLVAISQAHQAAELESPTKHLLVRSVWAGIRRVHGTAQEGKMPTLTADIRAMVDGLPRSLIGQRDRALLLLGFACAFRRSELVSIDVEDLMFGRGGLVVNLRRSKTDQEGVGVKIGVPNGAHTQTCPVRAIRAWLGAAGIERGPAFRPVTRHGRMSPSRLSNKAVALIVKRAVERVGLDPALYAGHSLRAGLATAAAAAGVEERKIMDQTRHKSVYMVRKYIRDGELFRDNAAGAVGL